jgi:pimeloyl-ACP methyl ester carboxylesterase
MKEVWQHELSEMRRTIAQYTATLRLMREFGAHDYFLSGNLNMFIIVDDAKIFATAYGASTAPAIIGIGGWIGNWELWLDSFALLSDQWRTIAYDHRGSGATIASVESITLERMVDDLFFVMDTFGVQRAIIAAESAGARTALAATLKHPTRVSALVLVDGLVQDDTPEEKDTFMTNLQANYLGTLQGFVNACLPDPAHAHLLRWGMQMLTRATPEAAAQLLRAAKTPDLRADVRRITQPTLLIHCVGDTLVPVESARWLAAELPHAHLHLFDSGEHVPTVTRPSEVAQVMRDFLKNVS